MLQRTIVLTAPCPVCQGRPMRLTSLLTGAVVELPWCPSWFHGRDIPLTPVEEAS
jgi:hypothetical protein